MSLGVGKALMSSNITWNEETIEFSVLHLGGHIINCGVKMFHDENEMNNIHNEIKQAFDKSDIPEVIRLIDYHYNHENYSLINLFKDEQRRVFNIILESVFDEIGVHFRQIFEEDYHIMYFMKELQIPAPKAIITPAEFILNNDIRKMLNSESIDFERLEQLVGEYVKLGIEPDNELSYEGNKKIISLVKNLAKNPDDVEQLQKIYNIIHLLSELKLDIDFWEATNIFFLIGRQKYDEFKSKAEAGDEKFKSWLDYFNKISYFLNLGFS